MRVLVGTSGYSYKEWKGSFYPADLPAKEMLRTYAARFGTVEINNTFYKMPPREMLEKWLPQVPPGFVFALKAPQRITHQQRLQDSGDTVRHFLDVAACLGTQLGPVLFQLPPFAKKDLPRLVEFLSILPPAPRCAFEFRHESWFADDVFAALGEKDVALCWASSEKLSTPPVSTATWGYLRLREVVYSDAELAAWATRISSQPWQEAYVFFKHEEKGTGPRLAGELLGHLGIR